MRSPHAVFCCFSTHSTLNVLPVLRICCRILIRSTKSKRDSCGKSTSTCPSGPACCSVLGVRRSVRCCRIHGRLRSRKRCRKRSLLSACSSNRSCSRLALSRREHRFKVGVGHGCGGAGKCLKVARLQWYVQSTLDLLRSHEG